MGKNVKILGILTTIIVIFGFGTVKANRTDINTSLIGTSVRNAGAYINYRTSPALYTNSTTYDTLFTITDADGNYLQYYNAYVGGTFTVSQPDSIKGDSAGTIIQLYLKSKNFHITNSYSGILFH